MLDHLVLATDDLERSVREFAAATGVEPAEGAAGAELRPVEAMSRRTPTGEPGLQATVAGPGGTYALR